MATITDYTDLVTLKETKSYCRIDDDITELSTELTLMINSACEIIEQYTQVYLKPQSKVFYFDSNCEARVYATPITAITLPVDADDYNVEIKQLYSIYTPNNADLKSITASIGYNDTDDVKSVFKLAAMECVRLWFYGSETEKIIKGYMPSSVMAMLSQERRFII